MNIEAGFFGTNRNIKPLSPELKIKREAKGEKLKGGVETTPSRVLLKYGSREKLIGGLIKKKFNLGNYPDYLRGSNAELSAQKNRLNDILSRWNYIKKVNSRRKRENKNTFLIPNTIRGYVNGNEVGLLVTDLSKEGKLELVDLKSIHKWIRQGVINYDQWESIKRKVLEDMEIAQEEGIYLKSGPNEESCVDPWLVVHEPGSDQFQVYLSDIGVHTRIVPKNRTDLLAMGTEKMKKSLELIENKFGKKTVK